MPAGQDMAVLPGRVPCHDLGAYPLADYPCQIVCHVRDFESVLFPGFPQRQERSRERGLCGDGIGEPEGAGLVKAG